MEERLFNLVNLCSTKYGPCAFFLYTVFQHIPFVVQQKRIYLLQ